MSIRFCSQCGKNLELLDGYGDPLICYDCMIEIEEEEQEFSD